MQLLVTGHWLAVSLMARREREREREIEYACIDVIYRYIYTHTHVCITFAVCLSLALPHPVEASGEPSNNAAAKACTFSLASGLDTSTCSIFVLFWFL